MERMKACLSYPRNLMVFVGGRKVRAAFNDQTTNFSTLFSDFSVV